VHLKAYVSSFSKHYVDTKSLNCHLRINTSRSMARFLAAQRSEARCLLSGPSGILTSRA